MEIRARHSVPKATRNTMPVGMEIISVENMKKGRSAGAIPLMNRWCCQTNQLSSVTPSSRRLGDPVAPKGLSREDRQHLEHDAERGQDEDVDLWVAEEPEEVLPEVSGAAARGDEERGGNVRSRVSMTGPRQQGRGDRCRETRSRKRPTRRSGAWSTHPGGAERDDRRQHVEAGQTIDSPIRVNPTR